MSLFRFSRVAIAAAVFATFNSSVFAQIRQGPNLELGGFQVSQLNVTDSRFDPYVMQRTFTVDYDEPVREGLVDVRIDVDSMGKVGNVRVLGGFYDDTFLKEAVNGIEGSTFKPATEGGMPVEWTQLDMRILLRGQFVAGVEEKMKQQFASLLELVKAAKYAEAETFAQELLKTKVERLFEYAFVQNELATIYVETGRPQEALTASRNATAWTKAVIPIIPPDSRIKFDDRNYPDEFLSSDLYLTAMRKRFLIALASNQAGEALRTYALLKPKAEIAGDTALLAELQPRLTELETALAAEMPVGSVIKLLQGVWSYPLSTRRTLGVTGMQGNVSIIDVNCKGANKRRLPFQNDTEFKIPASWGECALEFRGDDNSQFTLYEYRD